jgi:quercetin dioxygenase-like cupin family protein
MVGRPARQKTHSPREPVSDVVHAPNTPVVHTEATQFRWAELRRTIRWNIHGAETWGFHRGVYPEIQAATVRTHVVITPVGQSSQWHKVSSDRIFFQLQGEVEFYADGKTFLQKQFDAIVIPANCPYRYMNVGLVEALFYSARGYDPSPPIYEDPTG